MFNFNYQLIITENYSLRLVKSMTSKRSSPAKYMSVNTTPNKYKQTYKKKLFNSATFVLNFLYLMKGNFLQANFWQNKAYAIRLKIN